MEFLIGISQQQEHVESSFSEIEFAQKITSLINSDGGVLLVGINQKGKIKGVFPQEEIVNISVVIENYCTAKFDFTTEVIEVENKLLLLVAVKQGDKVAVLSNPNTIHYYFRLDGKLMQSNKIVERYWKFQQQKHSTCPCSELELESILHNIEGTTLSQIYTKSNLNKSLVDTTISWLLAKQLIEMRLDGEHVIYQHLI
jgi:predicted HTH transcriptional regulator